MSYARNNIFTSDRYTEPSTLYCPGAERINFDVFNATIYYQLGEGIGAPMWGDEIFLAPGFRSIDRHTDAVRVRSAVTGKSARVTLEAIPGDQVPNA